MRTEEELMNMLDLLMDDLKSYTSRGVQVGNKFLEGDAVVNWHDALLWVLNDKEEK